MFLDNTFFLMNKNRKLLTFQVCRSELGTVKLKETSREDNSLLPVGFSDIQSWVARRQAPKHRAHIEKLLRLCGCYDLEGYIRVTYALTLNDTFWVCPAASDLTWERVSLFQNDFDETIAHLAFEGGLYGESFSTTSPEFGTSGSFAKCWIRENGIIYLMKQGSEGERNAGLEPYSEMYASEVAEAFCRTYVPYQTEMFRGKLVSRCPLFTDEHTGFVTIHTAARDILDPEDILSYMETYGAGDDFRRMIVLDALIINTDRHKGNYGMLFDTDTLEITGMAPVFDHNQALLPYAEEEDFQEMDAYLSERPTRIGEDFNEIAYGVLTPEIRADLKNLSGFQFSRNRLYGLSEERLSVLDQLVNTQIDRILHRKRLYIRGLR
ncbi:MAG: HipA protein [Lachnospiraceae bacterium]|nr:HipA protein [Lachnospiraceae bacterium]